MRETDQGKELDAALQQVADLEATLMATTEHADLILAELESVNERLQHEVAERERAELRLQQLVEAMVQKNADLEIIIQTLASHGDEMEAQWWTDICDARCKMYEDELTGLPNRHRLKEFLADQWVAHQGNDEALGLVICDVDAFKAFNDTYGHVSGDSCLKKIGQSLAGLTADSDLLAARFGGEEFIVVVPYTDHARLLQVAERVLEAVRRLRIPHQASGVEGVVTVSVGAAAVVPDADSDHRRLIRLADDELYRAKNAGRNRCRVADF